MCDVKISDSLVGRWLWSKRKQSLFFVYTQNLLWTDTSSIYGNKICYWKLLNNHGWTYSNLPYLTEYFKYLFLLKDCKLYDHTPCHPSFSIVYSAEALLGYHWKQQSNWLCDGKLGFWQGRGFSLHQCFYTGHVFHALSFLVGIFQDTLDGV